MTYINSRQKVILTSSLSILCGMLKMIKTSMHQNQINSSYLTYTYIQPCMRACVHLQTRQLEKKLTVKEGNEL